MHVVKPLSDKVRVTFSLPYHDEVMVCLVGDFNDWRREVTPMKRADGGQWEAKLDLKPNSKYRYSYLVNDYIWHSDPDADDYAPGPFGEEAAVISTDITRKPFVTRTYPVHYLSSKDRERFLAEQQNEQYKRVLVPFEGWFLLEPVLGTALDVAGQSKAELCLLCLCHDNEISDMGLEQANMYTALKGLQARMQHYPVSVKVDTAVGRAADSVVKYADAHDVDLIVLADEPEDMVSEENLATAVINQAHCTTLIVRDN